MIIVVFSFDADASEHLRIEVLSDQRVTLAGREPSLKTVIEDVCYRVGIDLLFYDAADRPFGGTYQNLPVDELFARLLKEESYMLDRMRMPGSDRDHVVALRVLGDPAIANARRASGQGRTRARFQVPPALLDTAFGASEDPDRKARDEALAMIGSRISGDPVQLQGFLATPAHLIAEVIQRYKGIETPLRELQSRYPDPRVSAKIDEIIAALGKLPPGGVERPPILVH